MAIILHPLKREYRLTSEHTAPITFFLVCNASQTCFIAPVNNKYSLFVNTAVTAS